MSKLMHHWYPEGLACPAIHFEGFACCCASVHESGSQVWQSSGTHRGAACLLGHRSSCPGCKMGFTRALASPPARSRFAQPLRYLDWRASAVKSACLRRPLKSEWDLPSRPYGIFIPRTAILERVLERSLAKCGKEFRQIRLVILPNPKIWAIDRLPAPRLYLRRPL